MGGGGANGTENNVKGTVCEWRLSMIAALGMSNFRCLSDLAVEKTGFKL